MGIASLRVEIWKADLQKHSRSATYTTATVTEITCRQISKEAFYHLVAWKEWVENISFSFLDKESLRSGQDRAWFCAYSDNNNLTTETFSLHSMKVMAQSVIRKSNDFEIK